MTDHARLGVLENGRAATRAASSAFAMYAKMLRDDVDWFDGLDAHDPAAALQHLVERVGRVAELLNAEAVFLERRCQLRDAATVERVPLLGVAVQGERGLELLPFSLDSAIDEVQHP